MNAAIIVAAGTGSRMNSATPKQFLPLDNEMVLTRTVRVFEESPEIQEIVLVDDQPRDQCLQSHVIRAC